MKTQLRYIRINANTIVGTRSRLSDDQVRERFFENLKLSPYYNPKKFFVIS